MKIFDTIVSMFKRPDNKTAIRTETLISDNILATMSSMMIIDRLTEDVAQKIADKFVKLYGKKIMDKISLKNIVKTSTAKVSIEVAREVTKNILKK